jgi:hypothetical protein
VAETSTDDNFVVTLNLPTAPEQKFFESSAAQVLNGVATGFNSKVDSEAEKNSLKAAKISQTLIDLKVKAAGLFYGWMQHYKGDKRDLAMFFTIVNRSNVDTSKDTLAINNSDNLYISETIENLARLLGIMAATQSLDAAGVAAEREKVLSIMTTYKETERSLAALKKTMVSSQGKLLKLESPAGASQMAPTVTIPAASRLSRPMFGMVAGAFVGCFVAFVIGGLSLFLRTNWQRIRAAAAK